MMVSVYNGSMAKPSVRTILRRRKYQRLLALLSLTGILLGGFAAFWGLTERGYEIRTIPSTRWLGRERDWRVQVRYADPVGAWSQSIQDYHLCGNILPYQDSLRARFATVQDRRIYTVGIFEIATPIAFEATAMEQAYRKSETKR
jgi:hypothetical protein